MSEDPLVVHDVSQDTALGVPPMVTTPPWDGAPTAGLHALPALEALPLYVPKPVKVPPPVVPSATIVAASPTRVAPPTSRAMSSRRRRAKAQALDLLLIVLTVGVGWSLWSLVAWRHGQTPAKRLMGMRCIDTRAGAAARFGTMARREVALKWVPAVVTLGVAYGVGGAVACGERREALWDKGAKTIVVDDPDGRWRPERARRAAA